ncbi:MAG: DNA polymerase III subunit chi [Rickettsiales bacterium]|jgi:DNA polymerase IIIc chi subunit|nr:DNA polymerase III subunit chi [Rickettsiales bacterium]
MTEINFYCVDGDVNLFIYNFLNQLIHKNGKKVLLYSNSLEKLKKLDEILWEIGKNGTDFLPHSVYSDKNNQYKYEKLLLCNKPINFNQANYLLLSNFVDDCNFINYFEKIFYIYTSSSEKNLEQARKSLEGYQDLDYKTTVNVKGKNGSWLVQSTI